MKRVVVLMCCGFFLAGLGSSCAQPRTFVGGGGAFIGRPVPPPRHFYGPAPVVIVKPRVLVVPRARGAFIAPRPLGWNRAWRRGC